MKVGDMVMWYSDNVQDIGIVTKCDDVQNHSLGVFISWFSGDGNGWFDIGHPSIGVISESR